MIGSLHRSLRRHPMVLRILSSAALILAACAPSLPPEEEELLRRTITKTATWGGQKERFVAIATPQARADLEALCAAPPMTPLPNLPHGGIPIEILNAHSKRCDWPLTCDAPARDLTIASFSTKRTSDETATATVVLASAEVQRTIRIELARVASGGWRISRLPPCPDGLFMKESL
jgi:hypothetical protein